MMVYCQGTYGERVEQSKEAVKRLAPHVDRVVLIVDETVNEQQKKELKEINGNVEVYFHFWNDNFPEMRNHYLEKLQHGDWCIVSDPDEWFGKKFCQEARNICKYGDEKGFNLLLINSRDIEHHQDGPNTEMRSTFYKNLIFKFAIGTVYRGCGVQKNVHEILDLSSKGNTARLSDDYYYEHHKFIHEVWERAMRNVYIGGGGNNVGDVNASWKPLKDICTKLNINEWRSLRAYMRKGQVDPELIKWLNDNRKQGYDWQNEMCDCWRWYFKFLHPEENMGKLDVLPADEKTKEETETMKFVEDTYLKILGRHADTEGKQAYTKLILDGKIKNEQLEGHLKKSAEYISLHQAQAPMDMIKALATKIIEIVESMKK
jgi:hypothetical protein